MDRIVKTYPVSEHELTTIGTLSLAAAFCFSVASDAVSLALGLWLDVEQEVDAATKNMSFVHRMVWLFIAVAVVFAIVGGVSLLFRFREWDKIRKEAVESTT